MFDDGVIVGLAVLGADRRRLRNVLDAAIAVVIADSHVAMVSSRFSSYLYALLNSADPLVTLLVVEFPRGKRKGASRNYGPRRTLLSVRYE